MSENIIKFPAPPARHDPAWLRDLAFRLLDKPRGLPRRPAPNDPEAA